MCSHNYKMIADDLYLHSNPLAASHAFDPSSGAPSAERHKKK
jgi:hypothetical protein